jgi:hypothetical protein
VLAKILL